MSAYMSQRWYAVVNDEIGGYAVANVDKPVSAHDLEQGERAIGEFFSEQAAKHVAELHNRAVSAYTEPQPPCDRPTCKTVSNEDREAARAVVASKLPKRGTVGMYVDLSIVNAMVSHGWGPRPVVQREALIEHLRHVQAQAAEVIAGNVYLNAGTMASVLTPFLRECGIEVPDGD